MRWCQSRGADSSVTLFGIGHHLSPPGNILTSQGLNLVYNTKARVTKAFKLDAGVDSQPTEVGFVTAVSASGSVKFLPAV